MKADLADLVLEARWGGGWGGHQGEQLLISISARGFDGSLYLESGRKLGNWWENGSQEQEMKVPSGLAPSSPASLTFFCPGRQMQALTNNFYTSE